MNGAISRDLTSIVLAVLLLAILMMLSFTVLRPFLPALIWAATIVIASWPLMLTIQARLKGSRVLAVCVMVTGLILILLLPLTVALFAVIENIEPASAKIQEIAQNGLPPAPEWLGHLPLVGEKLAARWDQAAHLGKDEFITKLSPFIGQTVTWLAQLLGGFGLIIVHFLLTVLLATIFYLNGEKAARGMVRFSRRLAKDRGEQAVVLAGQAIRAVANGVVITALVQALMAGFGFLVAGIPYAVILTCVTFLLSVMQIGAAPVLIGSVIWLFYSGATIMAWIFLVWAIIVVVADNFIRPFLIKRGADIPLIIIFAGVIGGLMTLGVIGIFVGPVALAVSYTLLQAWISETEGSSKASVI